jgi:hypothetical protein
VGKEAIYKDRSENVELTRRRLVFSLRHQEGGAHIGKLTDRHYIHLKSGGGWFAGVGNKPPESLVGAALATMRQVAWELTETLKQLDSLT